MLSEITVGHLRGGGGTIPEAKRVPGGLLGADYEIVERPLSLQENLHRRELESAAARAAGAAGPERLRQAIICWP